jgi:hypothetical protein
MYANSIHLIDYFTFLSNGIIRRVNPISRWNPRNPDPVIAFIEYDNGDTGLYEGIWNKPGPWAVSVTTQEKRYELRPLERLLIQNYGERTFQEIPPHPWDTQFKPGLRLQAKEVMASCLGKASRVPTLAEAMDTMKLIHQIYLPSDSSVH